MTNGRNSTRKFDTALIMVMDFSGQLLIALSWDFFFGWRIKAEHI